MEKVYVTWEEVDEYVDLVTEKYKDANLTGVCGLPKGGLVLAVMVAYRMNIPLLLAPAKDCLIIDDIADTGLTLQHYDEKKKYKIATMFYHKQSTVVPDFWWKEKKDSWICYPWEKGEI